MESLNYFDVIIIVFTLLFGIKGLMSGFIKEAFGLIGLIGGVYVASRMNEEVGTIVASFIGITNEATISLVGFISTIVLFWIGAYLIGTILKNIIKMSGLGVFDKILGFLAGASKVFVIASVIVYAISNVSAIKSSLPDSVTKSIMYPVLSKIGSVVIKLDPVGGTKKAIDNIDDGIKQSVQEQIDKSIDKLKDKSKDLDKQIKELKDGL
jgi:membrane protein required for colicin V production